MLKQSPVRKIVVLAILTFSPLIFIGKRLDERYSRATSITITINDHEETTPVTHGQSLLCSADAIIQDSYDRWYRPFVEQCSMDLKDYECCERYVNRTDAASLPWWFHSLLDRQQKSSGAFGWWHYFQFSDPYVQLCAIEKVAITQWRNINEIVSGRKNPSGWRRKIRNGTKIPKAVFLRDPLERFLSGYLNKCVVEPHKGRCEPNFIYKPPNSYASMLHKKHHFESLIATIPFGWNYHFVPQAFFCKGLFRTIGEYDFIGNMDSHTFVRDLKRFQEQFPGSVADAVQQVYHLDQAEEDFRTVLDQINATHYTNAPKQVLEYYSAESVRQVLKYLAIDYVTLNLTVPTWVDEILRNDCEGTAARFYQRAIP